MADTVNAVDRCCANVERAKRELLQPRPRPGGLVFLAGGLPLRSLPKCPPPFTQFQVFSTQVIAFVLPTCWVRHSLPRLDFSIVDTFAYSRGPFNHSSSPHFGLTFSAAVVSQLCYRRHGCHEKRFRFVGVHHR